MAYRLFLTALLGLCIAGCVTIASNSLPQDQIATFRLQSVSVHLPPEAQIWWGEGERAFASSKGLSALQAEEAIKSEEGQAHLRTAVSAKLTQAFENQLRGELVGTRPVRIEMNVKELTIASAVQRTVLGGHHQLKADVNLVDARSGAVILAYPEQVAVAHGGQGLPGVLFDAAFRKDSIDRLIDVYVNRYRNWLLRK